jgi:hypothetical protein
MIAIIRGQLFNPFIKHGHLIKYEVAKQEIIKADVPYKYSVIL